MIVDSHCHLNNVHLLADVEGVILRAKNAGVGILNTICTKLSDIEEIKKISEQYDNVFYSVGIHPHEVATDGVLNVAQIIELTKHHKVKGIGETGLDYYYEHSDRALQKLSFINHIKAARQAKLPLIIHTRDADQDMEEILSAENKDGEFSGVMHCFTSTKRLAHKALDLGLYISISGIVTFKNATHVQELAKLIPLDRLLLETDAPYLAPNPVRGKTNEPSFITHTTKFVATLLNVKQEVLEEATTTNFCTLFNVSGHTKS